MATFSESRYSFFHMHYLTVLKYSCIKRWAMKFYFKRNYFNLVDLCCIFCQCLENRNIWFFIKTLNQFHVTKICTFVVLVFYLAFFFFFLWKGFLVVYLLLPVDLATEIMLLTHWETELGNSRVKWWVEQYVTEMNIQGIYLLS